MIFHEILGHILVIQHKIAALSFKDSDDRYEVMRS